MEAITNLWAGRAGLAKAYWGWGVLGGLLWGVALSLVTPGSVPAILAMLVLTAYFLIVNTGIWRAASHYSGLAIWAVLAKVAAAVGFLTIAAMVAAIGSVAWDTTRQVVQPVSAPQQPASSADDEWWKKGSTLVR